jgi:protein TonB
MVPPEEIENAPTTLPADFGEWDSGEDSAAQHAAVNGFEGSKSSSAPRPAAKTVTARVAVLPAASRKPAPAPRPAATPYADPEPVYQQRSVKATASRQQDESADEEKKKAPLVAIGAVVVVLALAGAGYLKFRPSAAAPVQPATTQTSIANLQKPTPSTPTEGNTSAAPSQQAPADQTTETTDRPLRAQSDTMNKQLNAPSRIPTDLKMLAGKQAPPSTDFGSAGGEGLGGGNVFSGQSGPKVKVEASKKVNISAGVAVGLLVQKTAPVYPAIARSAHVSGTVVIQATISKAGAIGNLRVVSGPPLLRQAALDAVKTWRFRPYMLDGEPVDVDTAVNVTFAMAQ